MMKSNSLIVFALLLTSLAACTKERVYGNIYDGLQKREQMVHPDTGLRAAEPQGYEAYQRERARSLEEKD